MFPWRLEDRFCSSIAEHCVEGGEMSIRDTTKRLLSSVCVYIPKHMCVFVGV